VKLAESATHWHAHNESGLYSVPYEDLKYVRYYEDDCPALRDVQWRLRLKQKHGCNHH
jgi:hypothetical protein